MYVESHFFGDYFMKLICWFHFMFSTMHLNWKQNTMLHFMIHNYNYMFQVTCFRTMWTNGGLDLQMGRIRCQLCLPQSFTWGEIVPITPSIEHGLTRPTKEKICAHLQVKCEWCNVGLVTSICQPPYTLIKRTL